MSGRKDREKRSGSPGKCRIEKERKLKQSSTKRRDTKRKDKPEKSPKSHDRSDDEGKIRQSTNRGLNDYGFGANSLRTYPSDDALLKGGREKPGKAMGEDPPFNGFFNFSAPTGSREAYGRSSPKKTTEDPFAYIRKKMTNLKDLKRNKKDKKNSKNKGGSNDSSGSDCDKSEESGCSTDSETSGGSESSGDSESSGNSDKSGDSKCNSDADSPGDDCGNSVDPKNTKHRSKTMAASGVENHGSQRRREPRHSAASTAGRRDKSKITTNEILPRELLKLSLTPKKYEWQFFDERWITYGQANISGPQPSETASTSDDIEAFYLSRYPEQRYMQIKNKYRTYELDLEGMIQTNTSTSAKRPIRRNPKQAANTSSSLELCNSNGPRGDSRRSHDPKLTRRLWQFKDESGAWITYGQSSQAGGHGSGTTTSSDDIENFRLRNPDNVIMFIQSSLHKYKLDFQQLTQTNISTSVQRDIRCVPFIASNTNIAMGASGQAFEGYNSRGALREGFVWQFQDDNGAWITYGRASSAQGPSFATTATSDDIEQFYNVKRGSVPMFISNSHSQFLLDFQTKNQTNLTTQYQRKIRRIPKHEADT